MSAHTLALAYSPAEAVSVAETWVRLEQQPVSSGRLTMADMQRMLTLVLSGTSARAYRPPTCEAYILGDEARADLAAWVWPSDLALAYNLSGDLVTVGPAQSFRQERDFDLVVEMSDRVELPFVMDGVTSTWQTPCYNRFGAEVGRPALTIEPAAIVLAAEVFGVLRVRGDALGYRHPLTFAMQKTEVEAITNLKPALTASWMLADGIQATERIELDLPACLTELLALCPDGISQREHALQSISPPPELLPTVYFSTCTGRVLALRYEQP